YIESALTGTGRVNGSYFDMVLRTAVLEDAFFQIDRVTGGTPLWPGGHTAYVYGAMFADALAREHGEEASERVVARSASAWVPPAIAFDRVGRRALDRSFSDAFAAWQASLDERYGRFADSLRAAGITETQRLPGGGYEVRFPRVGPDGRIVYAAFDGRNAPATRILDPATGREERLARRNGLDAVAWLPDGSVLTAQTEWFDRYRYYGDLVRVTAD